MRRTSDDESVREGEPDDSTRPAPQLGLFAKLPRPGAVKTRLTPPLSADEACRLYEAFLTDLGELPNQLPEVEHTLYLVPNEDEPASQALLPSWRHAWQRGGNLGERLAHALEELLARGGPAVILGSDHPDVPRTALRDAFAALAHDDVVLGPTPDGGYYLIGVRRPTPGLFDEVPWSSPETAARTEANAARLGKSVARLPAWSDVDSWDDVLALAKRLESNPEQAPATARACRELSVRFGEDRAR